MKINCILLGIILVLLATSFPGGSEALAKTPKKPPSSNAPVGGESGGEGAGPGETTAWEVRAAALVGVPPERDRGDGSARLARKLCPDPGVGWYYLGLKGDILDPIHNCGFCKPPLARKGIAGTPE